uniref:Uncharacterized protein n=1 Tax=Setaria italica TaxID=4555 RepID=K3YX98_SETIT
MLGTAISSPPRPGRHPDLIPPGTDPGKAMTRGGAGGAARWRHGTSPMATTATVTATTTASRLTSTLSVPFLPGFAGLPPASN